MRAPAPMRVVADDARARRTDSRAARPDRSTALAPRWTSTAPGMSHFNGRSPRSHRRVDRDQRAHHAGAEAPVGQRRPRRWRSASTKSAHWFLSGSLGSTFGLMMSPSRTSSLNSPNESAIASPAETPRSNTRTRSTSLRSSNTTRRRLPTATTSRTLFGSAQLTWMLPMTSLLIAERREGDVFAVGLQDAGADRRRPQRLLVEQVVEDGDVVRRQVPRGVDVLADRAEVGPRRVQVIRLAELHRAPSPLSSCARRRCTETCSRPSAARPAASARSQSARSRRRAAPSAFRPARDGRWPAMRGPALRASRPASR